MNVRRWIRRLAWGLVGLIAFVILAILAGLTVDLGPLVRQRAERAASNYLQRPMHIGRIGIHLFTGNFVVEDLRIEGKTPADHPFFTAKRIVVDLARGAFGSGWSFYRTRDFVIKSVEMTDWDMQVELKDGGDSFPNLKPKTPSTGKRNFVVTVDRVHAYRGRFTYIDHGTWRVTTSPNLDIVVNHDAGEYRGRAQFSNGSVQIKDYQPMRLAFRSDYNIDGGKVHLNWIDLATDGSHSLVSGDVDLGNWPEMFFKVHTDRVDFPRMKEIFFTDEKFTVAGEGKFNGTFHVFKDRAARRTSFELNGGFTSPLTTINDWAHFRDLAGDLRWVPNRFDVTKTATRFERGRVDLTFSIAPIGQAEPTIARLDTAYTGVDMAGFTDVLKTQGTRLSGRASGRNLLEWPTGHFRQHRGAGELTIRPTDGTSLYTRTSEPHPRERPVGPTFSYLGAVPNLGYLPVAGTVRYDFGPEWVNVAPSALSTPYTYLEFSGRTAYGDQSALDFYARSGDWQESERLLSAAITAFGSPTRTVVLGGYGEFTGRMLNSFSHPRIEGSFDGQDVRAFDVTWGHTRGNVVVENSYVDVTDGLVTQGTSEMRVDGRFSLSTPREDRGDEIDTRVRLTGWPIADIRHAFELDDYPIEGRIGGDYHVFGAYRRPFGYGTMNVARAVAYGEPIEQGTALLRLEGTGARVDQVVMTKAGGTITGAAYVGWDGRYSFNADGRRIPMESVEAVKYPEAPLSGVLAFRARGGSTFANPKFEITNIQIADLFVKDEGIGQVAGKLAIADRLMTLQLEAASPRLLVSGSGQISLIPGADADLSFRITETSLDPFFRVLDPRLSPFTTATASGTLRVFGRLGDLKRLRVDASVDQLRLRLFDYDIRNAGPILLALDNEVVRLGGVTAKGQERQPLRLKGEDPGSGQTTTRLNLLGDVDLAAQRVDVRADGDADLAVLQGFFRDVRSSGHAKLAANIQGPLREPAFTGDATIDNGRIRYFSLPHSIDAITGPITFTAGAIRFGDPATGKDLTAQIGGGTVTLAGGMEMNGFVPARWAITANAENVRLRYPEGFNSVVDATLDLAGPYLAPTLKGTVDVRSAVLSKTIDISPGLMELAAAARSSGGSAAPAGAAPAPSAPAAFPLRFDLAIIARSTLRVENNVAHLVANADLRLSGTYDHPTLLGQAEVERGYVLFVGKRYVLTHGTIEFNNPTKIDPFFDVEAEVRARVPGQTYVINLHAVGTAKNLSPQITSDPPLSAVDVISLLLGDVRNPAEVRNAELRALQPQNAIERGRLLYSRVEQILLSPGVTNLNRAVESAFGLTTFQLTPSLLDEYQRFNPTARLTIGKQISNRVYLTISRSLYSPQEDVVYLLEFDQNDRVSWVLSRNEDKTYALDVRVRYRF